MNYNNRRDTFQFLRSIDKLNSKNIEVIVVDNGSKENIVPVLQTYFPHVNGVRSEQNLGFAGGNNLGVNSANGEFLYFVNNDTIFLEDHFSALANQLIKHPEIGAISPQLIYPDGRIQFQGKSTMNPLTGRTKDLHYDHKGLAPTSYIHGGAVMIKREVLDSVGIMPEHYFLYYEELAWSEQIKSAGFELAIDLKHEIVHDESATTSKISDLKTYFMTRNRMLFMRKYSSRYFLLFLLYFTTVVLPKETLKMLIRREFGNLKAIIAGAFWHMNHGPESRQLGYKFNYLKPVAA
ncbi:MAG: glycosyltransferase family 2 protein [Cytophagales bacterium]|nr:glycosyltransferase family 2 protein [Cytophagales bacterium]